MGLRLGQPDASLLTGLRTDGWSSVTGPTPPKDPVALMLDPNGHIILLTRQSIYQLEGDLQAKQRELKVMGMQVPLSKGDSPFRPVGPEPALRLATPFAAAMNPDNGSIVLWNQGVLQVLERDEAGKYQRVREKTFDGKPQAAVVASAGSTILVALASGTIWVLDSTNLDLRKEFQPQGRNQPKFAMASPKGNWFLVLFHHNKVWLWDARQQQEANRSFIGKSDISAAAFVGPDQMLIADRGSRITEYHLDPFRVGSQRVPNMGVLERVYRYGVLPFYTLFPKPGELDNMVAYLLTEQETAAVGPDSENLASTQVKLDYRGPVWSSLAFMGIVLMVTCLYVWRADF
jgi:hypothetical protein